MIPPGLRTLHHALLLTVLVSAGGCAAVGGRGATPSTSPTLTRAEIEAANLPTLYAVIERLRPRWLMVRGNPRLPSRPQIVVYQGSIQLGGVAALRQVGSETVESARYLDAAEASALPGLGGRRVHGAIILELKVGT